MSLIYNGYTQSIFAGTSDVIPITVYDVFTGQLADLTNATASFYATQNFTGSYCMFKDNQSTGGITFPSASAGLMQINLNPSDTERYQYTTRLFFNVLVNISGSYNVANGSLTVIQGANIQNNSTDYDQGWY